MNRIRVFIADDHSLMRMGLKAMLDVYPDVKIVGEAGRGRQAVELVRRLSPDVVIMDLMMPELNGAEATREILSVRPATKIVILTSYGSSIELLQAVQNGAVGVQFKEDPEENIIQVIRAVSKGETRIPAEIRREATNARESKALTPRQSEILHAVSRGLTNKDIAKLFGISDVGVQKHLKLIFAKIGAANRSEATGIALRTHLLKI